MTDFEGIARLKLVETRDHDRRRGPERNRFVEGLLFLGALLFVGIFGPWIIATWFAAL